MSTGVANVLTLTVVASFFDDPAPPKISREDKSYPNLWSYEVIETFFYSTESKKYLQVSLNGSSSYKSVACIRFGCGDTLEWSSLLQQAFMCKAKAVMVGRGPFI